MRKLLNSFGSKVLDSLSVCVSPGSAAGSCFCVNSLKEEEEEELEKKPLVAANGGQILRLKDVVNEGKQTLALCLKPKTVVLKVSMHCNGCAKKVEKHVSRIEGVTSYKVDLEKKMVVVIGDILPFEVLERISKVKTAQIWTAGI
ncbi:hypothetical protein Droror1_Dr00015760 [Drosera rotundifolia]